MNTNRFALRVAASSSVVLAMAFGMLSRADVPVSEEASSLADAIQAERDGDEARRQALLSDALDAAPDSPATRWHNGFVQIDDTWISASDLTDLPESSPFLDDYQRLRENSKPTIVSQLQLADFCHKHQLWAQERVHLSAILELEPDHGIARKRLGFERFNGAWHMPDELAAARRAAKEVAESLRKHGSTLKRLRELLKRGTLSQQQAVAELTRMQSVSVIPAWELFLSSSSSAGALAVVDALRNMPQPEATLSLARHGVFSEWWEVRKAAIEALRGRDEFAYIPSVLSALHGPWISQVDWVASRPGQELVYRYSAYSEGANRREMAVFDGVFFLTGAPRAATTEANAAAALDSAQRERLLQQENERIANLNAEITQFLRNVTDEQKAESPEDWWRWWSNRNGIVYTGKKPLAQSYAWAYTTIEGQQSSPQPHSNLAYSGKPIASQPPTPQRGPFPAGVALDDSSTSAFNSYFPYYSCLAAGTPVWTDHGPVAIDQIRLGDVVLSQDPVSGELAFKPVLRTTAGAAVPIYRIEAGGETIRASSGHAFWVSGQGWVRAWELQPGMVLHGVKQTTRVEEVVVEDPAPVFNLVVEGFHTYFVGANNVLTHDISVRAPVTQDVPGFVKGDIER